MQYWEKKDLILGLNIKFRNLLINQMIIDCIIFLENFITKVRFEILDSVVDYFIVCKSKYDHWGNKKKLNLKLKNKNFKKII